MVGLFLSVRVPAEAPCSLLTEFAPEVTGTLVGSALDGLKQVPQFLVDFLLVGDCFGDRAAQAVPAALAQSMHGDLDGSFGRAELLGQVAIRNGAVLPAEVRLQGVEDRAASRTRRTDPAASRRPC